jgi:hypothetical protein
VSGSFSVDRTTGWVSVHDGLDSVGARGSYCVEVITEPAMLIAARRREL